MSHEYGKDCFMFETPECLAEIRKKYAEEQKPFEWFPIPGIPNHEVTRCGKIRAYSAKYDFWMTMRHCRGSGDGTLVFRFLPCFTGWEKRRTMAVRKALVSVFGKEILQTDAYKKQFVRRSDDTDF